MTKNIKAKSSFKRHLEWPHSIGILVVFGSMGVAIIIGVIINYHTERAIANWPSVSGTIVVSRVTHHTDSDGDDYYRPYYSYEYKVDGYEFENDDFSFIIGTAKYSLKEEAIENKLKIGTKVSVFYNPKDPTDSYIHHTENISIFNFAFYLGVFFIGLGIFLGSLVLFEIINVQEVD